MAALPRPLDSSSPSGTAAGIGAMVLGVVVAVGLALLFIVVMGADRGQWTRAGAGYRARPNPGEIQATPAALRSSRMPINRAGRGSHGHLGPRCDGPRERRDRVVVDVEHLHATTATSAASTSASAVVYMSR
jgi:hypothetical protein